MAGEISIGDVEASPGTIQYGRWDALEHPTGHREFLPVILAQGRQEGPCIWLTAGIHGPEHAGPLVLYRLINESLVAQLRGTIVAIPALSPAGLRTRSREPYHADTDPNRLWPDGKSLGPVDPDTQPPTSLELAYRRLFEAIQSSADALIDFHNAWIGSLSFAFQDRVFYREDAESPAEPLSRPASEALARMQNEMLAAYGHTIVNEFPAEKYFDEKLHRSTSGAALLVGRIPAFTAELGTGLVPDLRIVEAAVRGARNVLRWAGMLPGPMEPIDQVRVVDPGYPIRRSSVLRVDQACVLHHLVEAGDTLAPGQAVAEIRDIWGRPIEDGYLRNHQEAVVLGRPHGIYFYPGDVALHIAIRDDAPLVAPYPAGFFENQGSK